MRSRLRAALCVRAKVNKLALPVGRGNDPRVKAHVSRAGGNTWPPQHNLPLHQLRADLGLDRDRLGVKRQNETLRNNVSYGSFRA